MAAELLSNCRSSNTVLRLLHRLRGREKGNGISATFVRPLHFFQSVACRRPRTFTISTLNRWSDQRDNARRTEALLQILRDSPTDVSCLQEMTAGCLSHLKADPLIRRNWIISNRDGMFGVSYGSSTWYGQMTLVRKGSSTVVDAREVNLNYQGNELRQLHIVDIELRPSGTRIQIINVHLQSLEKEGMARMYQVKLAAALAHQSTPKITLLAGDTNFYTEEGMQVPPREGFIDLWRTQRPNEKGHTFGVTYGIPEGQSERRIDGIFHWPSQDMKAISVQLFGHEHLPGHPGVFLSDHCGLTATFSVRERRGAASVLVDCLLGSGQIERSCNCSTRGRPSRQDRVSGTVLYLG